MELWKFGEHFADEIHHFWRTLKDLPVDENTFLYKFKKFLTVYKINATYILNKNKKIKIIAFDCEKFCDSIVFYNFR